MHLGCNPLGTSNINMKNLKPWASRQLDRRRNIAGSHTPFCWSLFATATQNYTVNQLQIIYARCPTCACASLICLPFHRDMRGDSHQGILTRHGVISIAMELPADFRCLLQPLVSNCRACTTCWPSWTTPHQHPGQQHLLQSSCPNPPRKIKSAGICFS